MTVTTNSADLAESVLGSFRVPDQPLYIVGTLDKGVTVLSQQYRALNLVWGLVLCDQVSAVDEKGAVKSIAIIGGGFAGLTVAAGLIKKEANAKITIFERHDTLLPLQQGSDARWLHPHIYDWPLEGSESSSAALPVLNWTAARASDVAVQVLRGWQSLLQEHPDCLDTSSAPQLRMFCNTRHLQIRTDPSADFPAEIEWVGEPRNPGSPANPIVGARGSDGMTERFHIIILTVGFGLEPGQTSYWRNETFAQPQLGQASMTYIVSGAGDGAMIDLFRLRIAQYRQDRILAELFAGREKLVACLRQLDQHPQAAEFVNLFDKFTDIWSASEHTADTVAVTEKLRCRLRHDTRVVLHVRQARFADLFDRGRVSFQNRMLAFLLFRVGGFHPSTESLESLRVQHGVPAERVIVRHGTNPKQAIKDVLAENLHWLINAAFHDPNQLRQAVDMRWSGGFFGYPGPKAPSDAKDVRRAGWRQEYLPSPTQAIAAAFCCGIAGYLASQHPEDSRLRVTFHRTLLIGTSVVLQQCCEYDGVALERTTTSGAGRTFEANHAMVGLAYVRSQIFRTVAGTDNEAINQEMKLLQLNESSRQMADSVESLAAIPVLGQARQAGAKAVIGVLYLDSEEKSYFSDEDRMRTLVAMTQQFATMLSAFTRTMAGGVVNNAFWSGGTEMTSLRLATDPRNLRTLEQAPQQPPVAPNLSQINFDYSDFEAVET